MTYIARCSAALVNDRLSALTRALDGATPPGKAKVYGTPMPSTGGASTSATLLAEFTFAKPSCLSVSGGVLSIAAPADVLGLATGVAEWVRFTDGAGVFVMDLNGGGLASGAAAIVVSDAGTNLVYLGGTVSLLATTLTET